VAIALTAGRRRSAIVCQSPYEGAGTVAFTRLLPLGLRPRVVIEVHGDWRTATRLYGSRWRGVVAPAADRAAAWALRHADRVRVVAEAGERLVREAGYRGAVDRYPAFVDMDGLAAGPPAPPPERPAVLFAGVFERYKAVDVLIEAWAAVVERVPDAHLLLAGDGPLRPAVQDRAAVLGLTRTTSFLGRVPKERMASLMDQSRLLVLPSRSEGLPRVILEAFSRERPVVATPVGGVGELVHEGETGWLVPVDDADALADALVAALSDPAEAARRGLRGRELLAERDPVAAYERGVHTLAGWIG
jgi:glycosyltransferase involved in cell wall biosynthesis